MFKIDEKNLLYLFIFIFVVSVGTVYFSLEEHAQEEAGKRIETILEQHKALHKYVENIQKPVLYDLKAQGKLYDEFFDPKVLSFTYIARNIHNLYKETKEKAGEEAYEYKLATNNPRNPLNMASDFEKNILNRFNKQQIKEFHTIIEEKGKKYFYKALPIGPNKKSCMKCHSVPEVAPQEMVQMYGKEAGYGESIGDIRAMITLKIPMTEIYKEAFKQFIIISLIISVLLVVFYILISRIIKQKYLLQQQMKENREKDALIAQQAKMIALGEMIRNIAHQWRQPLSIISTAASGLKVEKEFGKVSEERVFVTLDKITSTAQHMSRTIEQFRDFLDGDNQPRRFSLEEEIEKCLDIEDSIIKQNEITVLKRFEQSLVVNSLPHGLSQALVNIINNAKDVMEELEGEKLLFIETKKQADSAVIVIKDSGGGIPEEIIEKIFEPYFTTRHQSQGRGLGLHITYKIITENMHGMICVENETYTYKEKKYTGAKFTITLPLENKEQEEV